MIRGILTLTILWVIIAFSWDPFVSTVEKTQAVDKTKEIVYNVFNKAKEKVKNE
tara:strand:+ start:5869 stop:6030 length:162 start_codon:yes stop_codon:yes gene_type:complete